MSTHVEHGYRIPASTSPFELTRLARTALTPVYHSLYAVEVATRAAALWDTAHLTGTPLSRPALQAAAWHVAQERREIMKTGRRNPSADFTFDFTLLDDPEDPSFLYLLLFTEHDEYHAAFASLPGVEHWPYWNHTDPPADLSDEEWDLRRDTWNRVTRRSVPAEHGLAWTFLAANTPHVALGDIPDLLASSIPSQEARIGHFSRLHRAARFMNQSTETLAPVPDSLPPLTLDTLLGRA